jgi:hypothetical protein
MAFVPYFLALNGSFLGLGQLVPAFSMLSAFLESAGTSQAAELRE